MYFPDLTQGEKQGGSHCGEGERSEEPVLRQPHRRVQHPKQQLLHPQGAIQIPALTTRPTGGHTLRLVICLIFSTRQAKLLFFN